MWPKRTPASSASTRWRRAATTSRACKFAGMTWSCSARPRRRRDDGEERICDAEHRPDRADRTRLDQDAPARGDDRRRQNRARQPIGALEFRMYLAERLLKQKTRNARPRVDCREDEQRLEHD